MAAGLGFKTFTTGEVLTAADTNGYLMQGVLVFASAAARDAAITSPQEGQCCYLKDTDAVLTYSGSAWVGFDDSNAIQNSIVDAKGDLVAASGADTPARIAVGSNGETLVADSSATTGLRWNRTPYSSNVLLNSAFQIWQRGTSTAIPANTSTYSADRWTSYRTATGSTVSRQATNDTTNLAFIQYCARVQRDSGNTSTAIMYFTQAIESVNTIPLANLPITYSFYARAGANYSAASSTLSSQITTGTGTDQAPYAGYTGSATPLSGTHTLTTTWQRFTVSGSMPNNATEMLIQFQNTPVGTAGAADYYEITGVQINIGSVSLPFRTYSPTIAGELAACQRYYFRTTGGEVFANGIFFSGTKARVSLNCPVTMRTDSGAIDFNNLWLADGSSTYNATAVGYYYYGKQVKLLEVDVASGGTASRPVYLSANAGSSASYIGASAEL
jgi:hypothetical protein